MTGSWRHRCYRSTSIGWDCEPKDGVAWRPWPLQWRVIVFAWFAWPSNHFLVWISKVRAVKPSKTWKSRQTANWNHPGRGAVWARVRKMYNLYKVLRLAQGTWQGRAFFVSVPRRNTDEYFICTVEDIHETEDILSIMLYLWAVSSSYSLLEI